MAEIIPSLNQQTLGRMTSGEKRAARRLQELLEDDYQVWFDIPVGKNAVIPTLSSCIPHGDCYFWR